MERVGKKQQPTLESPPDPREAQSKLLEQLIDNSPRAARDYLRERLGDTKSPSARARLLREARGLLENARTPAEKKLARWVEAQMEKDTGRPQRDRVVAGRAARLVKGLDKLSTADRALIKRLNDPSEYAARRSFYSKSVGGRIFNDGGRRALGLLGKLDKQAMNKLFPDAKRRQLIMRMCTNAFLPRIREKVLRDLEGLSATLKKVQQDPRLLSKLPAAQSKALFGQLGLDAAKAERAGPQSEALRGALAKGLQAVDKAIRTVHPIDTINHEVDALAVYRLFRPVVRSLNNELGVLKGSVVDGALEARLADGHRVEKRFKLYQIGFGLAASLLSGGAFSSLITTTAASGVVTSGAAFASAGLSAATSAATSAITGLPSLARHHGRSNLAKIAEARKLADGGTAQKAAREAKKARTDYLKGVLISGAVSGAGSAAGSVLKKVKPGIEWDLPASAESTASAVASALEAATQAVKVLASKERPPSTRP